MLKDKYKLFSVIEGVIIIVLLIGLIISISNNKKDLTDTKDNKGTSDTTKQEVKPYVGIYHTNYYNTNKREVNITLNNDNTCEVSLYSKDVYSCTYEEINEDKINLKITTYLARLKGQQDGEYWGPGLANNMQECEDKLKELQQKDKEYNIYEGCIENPLTKEITLVNNGLLFNNVQFYKIK